MVNIDRGCHGDRRADDVESAGLKLWCGKSIKKMFSENTFAVIYDSIPFLFPKISNKKEKESKLSKILFVVMETAMFASLVPSVLNRVHSNTSEMSNFMKICFTT